MPAGCGSRLSSRCFWGWWFLCCPRGAPPAPSPRPKMGFSVPIDKWLRGPLRRWADDLLSDDAIRRGGVLDRGAVSRAWNGLKGGESSTGLALWTLVMFQAWRVRWQS